MTQDSSRTEDEGNEDLTPDADEPAEGSDTAAASDASPADKELATLRKRFHDTQKKLHEVTTENAKLSGKLEGVASTRQPAAEAPSDPYAGLDEAEVIANPYLIVDALRKSQTSLVQEVAQVIRQIRDEFGAKIESQHPDRIALAEEIDKLREDPDLDGLDDKALMAMAKRNRRLAAEQETVEEEEEPLERPMRTLPGTRRASAGVSDPKKGPLFRAIYGEMFDDKGGGK